MFLFWRDSLQVSVCFAISPAYVSFSVYLASLSYKSLEKSGRGKVSPLPDVVLCFILAGTGGSIRHALPYRQ